MSHVDPGRERHNEAQRRYYGTGIREAIRPVDTPYVRRQLDAVVAFGGLQPGMRVLEVGCGMGRHAHLLARRGFVMEGIELSPFLVEQFQAAADPDSAPIPVHCADLVSHPPALAGQFDAVVGFFVLHHFYDLDEGFTAVCRLLKPGGVCVFAEPNPFNPLYYLQVAFTPGMTWSEEKGLVNMRPRVIEAAMAHGGITGFRFQRFGFLPRFGANTAVGQWVDRRLEGIGALHPILPFTLLGGSRPA